MIGRAVTQPPEVQPDKFDTLICTYIYTATSSCIIWNVHTALVINDIGGVRINSAQESLSSLCLWKPDSNRSLVVLSLSDTLLAYSCTCYICNCLVFAICTAWSSCQIISRSSSSSYLLKSFLCFCIFFAGCLSLSISKPSGTSTFRRSNGYSNTIP